MCSNKSCAYLAANVCNDDLLTRLPFAITRVKKCGLRAGETRWNLQQQFYTNEVFVFLPVKQTRLQVSNWSNKAIPINKTVSQR